MSPESGNGNESFGLNIVGDLRADCGLSEASRSLLEVVISRKIPFSHHGAHYPIGSPKEMDRCFAELPEGVEYPVNLFLYNIHAFYSLVPGPLEDPARKKYSIAYWWWELPRLQDAWIKHIDRVDRIWVGSKFIQETFQKATDKPVVLVPTPVSVETSGEADRKNFGIPDESYVFLFTFHAMSGDDRKNPWAVIDAFRLAFGRSSPGGRSPLLVIKTRFLERFPELSRKLQREVDSVGGILINRSLSRTGANDLLDCSDAYVSLHRAEGFGLGMAEAMYLGKPVVGTNYSGNTDFMSPDFNYPVGYELREITEEAHRLQPELARVYKAGQMWAEPSIEEAAGYMARLYGNPAEGIGKGEKAKHFIRERYSSENAGRIVEEELGSVYEALGKQSVFRRYRRKMLKFSRGSEDRPRIAFWSPLPPAASGISDYSVELVRELAGRNQFTIAVYGNPDADEELFANLPVEVYGYDEYPYHRYNPAFRVDMHIYHMGNNLEYHEDIYRQMCHEPGIVVLHDPSLLNFFWEYLHSRGQSDYFFEEIERSDGAETRRMVEKHIAGETNDNLYDAKMDRSVVESNQAVIVHGENALRDLQSRYRDARVHYVPHGVPVPAAGCEEREDLSPGGRPGLLRIGVFGRITRDKRGNVILRCFARLLEKYPDSVIEIVGRNPDEEYLNELKGIIRDERIEGNVTVSGEVPFEEYLGRMELVDLVISLRWPTAGETSSSLMRSFGSGKVVIASDIPQTRELPEMFCRRIPVGEGEQEALFDLLVRAAEDREDLKRRGEEAQRFTREHASWEVCAARYADIISAAIGEKGLHRARTAKERFLGGMNRARHLLSQIQMGE